jgi:single-strand DNA-binding protein
MSASNIVTLFGNLVKDPEIKTLPKSAIVIANFALAVNEAYTDKDGEKQEEVSFVDVVAYGKLAETIGKYLTKGRRVLVRGRLRQERWQDKSTKENRSRIIVVIEEFTFADASKADAGAMPTKATDKGEGK